jgi:hypothetical protein
VKSATKQGATLRFLRFFGCPKRCPQNDYLIAEAYHINRRISVIGVGTVVRVIASLLKVMMMKVARQISMTMEVRKKMRLERSLMMLHTRLNMTGRHIRALWRNNSTKVTATFLQGF